MSVGDVTWPTILQASTRLGLSQSQFKAFAEHANVELRRVKNRWRVNPEQLEDESVLKACEQWLGSQEGEADVLRVERVDDSAVRQLQAATEALRMSATHAERLLSMVTSPAQELLKQHQLLNERLLERLESLEASHASLIEARESALNEAELRRLMAARETADIEMRQRALGLVETHLPSVLGGIAKASTPQGRAAMQLLSSLDPMMLEALREAELLTPEQQALLDQVVGPRPKKEDPS